VVEFLFFLWWWHKKKGLKKRLFRENDVFFGLVIDFSFFLPADFISFWSKNWSKKWILR
jgi:hypothetical protein